MNSSKINNNRDNEVYIAHVNYVHVFLNPIYLQYSIGVAQNVDEALKIVQRYFHSTQNYHLSNDYHVEKIVNDYNILLGWKFSIIDY